MALQTLGLGLLFTARDQASASVIGLTRNVRGLEGQASSTANTLKAGLGGLAAAAVGMGLAKVVDSAADFEFGLAKVGNIAMATADDMKILRDAAYEAGLKTQFSPTQAVEGLQNLAAAGFTAAESAKLLDQSPILAQAGQISIGQATATVATSIKLFNLQGKDQATLVDKLLKTTNLFKIQASDLEQGLAKTSAAALLTNQSVDEMLLTVGLIKNIFPDAGEAGNSISRAMQNLAQKSDKVKKIFGVDVIDPETGGFKNALDLFLEIDKASKTAIPDTANRAKELSKLFGSFGVKGFSAATASIREFATKNNLTMEESAARLRGAIEGADGTAEAFLASLNATFKGQRIILEGAVETLMVALGEPLLRILQPAVKAAAEGVSSLARRIRDMDPALKAAGAKIALVASAVLGAVASIALLRASAALMAPLFRAMAVSAAMTVVSMLPLIAVGAAVGAAALGIADAFGDSSSGAMSFADAAGAASVAMAALSKVIFTGRVGDETRDQLREAGASGLIPFIDGLASARKAVVGFFGGVRAAFKMGAADLGSAFRGLGDALYQLAEAFGLVSRAGSDASDSAPTAAFNAGATAARVMVFGLEALARVMSAVVRFGAQVVTGVRGAFEGSGPIMEAFSRAIGTLAFNLGIAGNAMASGGAEGASFGESLGAGIGRLLLLGVQLATVMVDATTQVVAGVKAIMPVVEPIFTFLADNIEWIAYLFAAKMAWSVGTKVVGAFGAWDTMLGAISSGSLRDAQGRFLKLPKAFRWIAEKAISAKSTVATVATTVATASRGAFRAALKFGELGGAMLASGARNIVAGIMNIPTYLMSIKSGAVAAARWIYIMGARMLAMGAKKILAGLAAVALQIKTVGDTAGRAALKARGLGSSIGGIAANSGSAFKNFGKWAGPLAAAALAGYEFGTMLDNWLGISDKLGESIANWTGESEKARSEKAKAIEQKANEALKVVKDSGTLRGRVVSDEIVASITAKIEKSRGIFGPSLARTGGLTKVSRGEMEDLGLTPQESAALQLLKSGLAMTSSQAMAKEVVGRVRTREEEAAFAASRGALAGRVIQRAAGGEIGIEDVKRVLSEGTLTANLAGLQFRRTQEAESANIAALIAEIRARDASVAAQIEASITAAKEAAAAAKAASSRPVVLQANARELATVVNQGGRDIEDDMFLGGDDSGVLD